MRADQERVRTLLSDTVTLLCKNGLAYDKELKVQGLLGITLDENEVFIVHINEKLDGGPGTDYSQRVFDLAINNNDIKEKSPPREKNNNKRTRKLQHDGPVPSKKPHVNHLPISPASLFRKKPTAYNNPFHLPESKNEDEDGINDDDEISQDDTGYDDRDAMRDCYNSDASELSPKPTCRDIPPPPPLALYGEKKTNTGNVGDNDNKSITAADEQEFDELQPPNSSVIGPFIAGIAHHVTPSQTGSSEASDHSWDDIGSSIGPLTQDGHVVLEGAAGQSSANTTAWEENEDSEDKLGTRKHISDSLMLYGLAHYANNVPITSSNNTATTNGESSAEHSPGRKGKEGRRSWTSKNKPYMCKVDGCNKSYFFVHDLRRHERQKHPERPLTGTGSKQGVGGDFPLDFSSASPINIVPEHCVDSPVNGTSSDTET